VCRACFFRCCFWLLIQCGILSWLPISFWTHVNIVYRIDRITMNRSQVWLLVRVLLCCASVSCISILPVSSRSIICYQTREIMASYGRGVLYLPHWLPAPDHPNGDEHHNHMLQSCSKTDWGLYLFYRCTKLPNLKSVVSATPVQLPQRVFSLIRMTSLILMHSKTAHKECAFWLCLSLTVVQHSWTWHKVAHSLQISY